MKPRYAIRLDSASGKCSFFKPFKQGLNSNAILVMLLILTLNSTFFLSCTANDNLIFHEFKIDFHEIKSTTPYELEPGQVYTAQNITYIDDYTFNVILYIELLEYGENIRPLVADSTVDFIYTLGSNFSLKEEPISPPGTFIDNSNVIIWSVPENLILPAVQINFTLELKPDWVLDKHYYTNSYVTTRFTPTNDNPYYYMTVTETIVDLAFVVQFSWNSGVNLFNWITIYDPELGTDFTLRPSENVEIGGIYYIWSTDMPSDTTDINTVGVYKTTELEKSTYYFWLKTASNGLFGADGGVIVYPVDVFSGGGNENDYATVNKTVYYTVAKQISSFNWETDNEGSHVVVELFDTGYIFITKNTTSQYDINYNLNGGINSPDNPNRYTINDLPLDIFDPSQEGYLFLGWDITLSDGTTQPLDFSAGKWQIPANTVGDIDLIANWEKIAFDNTYHIYYELNTGVTFVNNPPQHYTPETLPLNIDNPSRGGYTFLGWTITYSDKTSITVPPNYSIPHGTTGDLTLTALWEPSYSITYVLNDGTNALDNPIIYSQQLLPLKIHSPSHKNYDFLYWTITCDNGTQTTSQITAELYELPLGTTGAVILTANWRIPYNITYELFGGDNTDNLLTYTIDMLPLKIDNPIRINYLFIGWIIIYQNGTITNVNSATHYEIQKNTAGNLTLIAQWVPTVSSTTSKTTTPSAENRNTSNNPPSTSQPENNNNQTEPTPPQHNDEPAQLNLVFLFWTIVFAAGLIASTFTFKLKKDHINTSDPPK